MKLTTHEKPMNLTREHLPLFKVLPRPLIDINELRKQIIELGYDDYEKYKDLDVGGEYRHLCNQYNETHTRFINEEEAMKPRGQYDGQMYRQMALTEFDYGAYPGINSIDAVADKRKAIRSATNRSSPNYLPQLDERNYRIPNSRAKGLILDILSSFKAKFTRSRLAVLMPGFEGKPHIDYNTDYSIRIHIPIFTNDKSTFSYVTDDGTTTVHMPADGRMWCVNTGYTHYVSNNGTAPRLHMVVNLESQEDLYD